MNKLEDFKFGTLVTVSLPPFTYEATVIGYCLSYGSAPQIAVVMRNTLDEKRVNARETYTFDIPDIAILDDQPNPLCEFSKIPKYELGDAVNIDILDAPYDIGVIDSIVVNTIGISYGLILKGVSHPKDHTTLPVAVDEHFITPIAAAQNATQSSLHEKSSTSEKTKRGGPSRALNMEW